MKRRVRTGPGALNLDSFLDVLTNTIGVLVFVLLFVTLSAADASVLVRTPLRQETEKSALFLEIRGGRVLFIDTEKVQRDMNRMRSNLPDITYYTMDYVRDQIENFRTSTTNYRVEMVGVIGYTNLSLRYRAKAGAGDSLSALADSTSSFQRLLGTKPPEKFYLAFLVRPDGFEAYREARKLAWSKGYQVGWEPMTADREIFIGGSGSGRTVGVQ
jgi:hypothetical protein